MCQWDATTGERLQTLKAQWSVEIIAFSPDGATLASSVSQSVDLWDVATGLPIGEPLTGHDAEVGSVAFHPDGQTLASGGWDATVRLWNLDTRQQTGDPLTGHDIAGL